MQTTLGERQLDPVLAESVKNMVDKMMKEKAEHIKKRLLDAGADEKELAEHIEDVRINFQKRLEKTALEESKRAVRLRFGL